MTLASAYDAQGERTSLAASIAGVSDFINSYGYDKLSQMIMVQQQQQTGGNTVASKEIDLSYDALGRSHVARRLWVHRRRPAHRRDHRHVFLQPAGPAYVAQIYV